MQLHRACSSLRRGSLDSRNKTSLAFSVAIFERILMARKVLYRSSFRVCKHTLFYTRVCRALSLSRQVALDDSIRFNQAKRKVQSGCIEQKRSIFSKLSYKSIWFQTKIYTCVHMRDVIKPAIFTFQNVLVIIRT